jgi:hypothetical protein
MEKTCFKCGSTKPLHDYYKHPQMGDGHLNKCKDCTRLDARKMRDIKLADPEWVEKERKRHREKASCMDKKYPEKMGAHKAIRMMKKSNEVHLHHWSYLKEHWKDVIRLSATDHRMAHTMMVYDQEQMKYRKCHTMELLDTREAHEQYIQSVGCVILTDF